MKNHLNREDDDFCEECGLSLFDEGEDCDNCGDGPFCWGCYIEHQEIEHGPHCNACGVKLEIDPPCPICHREFCDGCIPTHVELCQRKEDIHIGIQPTLYSFIFEDGTKW